MDNNQQNPSDQNSTGISGFGSSPSNIPDANMNNTQMPKQNPNPFGQANNTPTSVPSVPEYPESRPVPQAPPAAPTPMPSPIMPDIPVSPMPTPMDKSPVNPDMSTGLELNQNFTKQSVVGGVEEPHSKSKAMFSAPAAPQPDQMGGDVPVNPPAYNEVTAPGSRNKFALIAVVVGVVLLLVAGGAYYYLVVMNKPAVETPIVEQPVPIVPVEDTTIEQDPYIMGINQLEATSSAEPTNIEQQVKSLNFDAIDMEIMMEPTQTQEVPTTQTQPTVPAQ